MKNKITMYILIAISTFLINDLINAQVYQDWVQRYKRSEFGSEIAKSVAADADGNVYVTGESYYGIGGDYVTIKYNSSGIQQWVQIYNGTGNNADLAISVAADGLGNVYVTGASMNLSANFDIVTIKYNSSGVEQWVKRYDGPDNSSEFPTSMILDISGNVYITGRWTYGGSISDYLTIKYSTSGDELWVQRLAGGSLYNIANSISVDGMSNVYVTGRRDYSGSDADYTTIKYNSSGAEEWVRIYTTPGGQTDIAKFILTDISGNVYVTGQSATSGIYETDFTTIKYNSSGAEQWVRRYNESSADSPSGMAADHLGNVYITGKVLNGNDLNYATIKYNPSGVELWVRNYEEIINEDDEATCIAVSEFGNVYVSGFSIGDGTFYDFATIKYNTDGVQQWVARFNAIGNSFDAVKSIAIDGLENVYVTGVSYDAKSGNTFTTIKYSQDSVLSVELSSFTSSVNNNNITLNWVTASETNNSGFDIELRDVRSETQDVWNKIGFVNGNGTVSSPNNYEFTDRNLASGKYNYRLKQIDFNGNYEYYNLNDEIVIGVPVKYSLEQNYPNPFNPVTNLEFGISNLEFVSLKVYDAMGKEVATLVNEIKPAGRYEIKFDGSNLSSGVYFYKIEAGSFSAVKRMILLK